MAACYFYSRRKRRKSSMNASMKRIYDDVIEYCRSKGLIRKLEQRLTIREHNKFGVQNVASDGLHILDAVHCIYDKKRTAFFLEEIDKHVSRDSIVLEAGLGTGILSFFAATKADTVYGLEINPSIYKLASDIRSYVTKKNIIRRMPIFIRADATRARLPQKSDVIINENIYTGMFYEKQVQIMNHVRTYLKPRGVVIPSRMNLYVALVHARFPHTPRHRELFVPLYEARITTTYLSKFNCYRVLDFTRPVDPHIRADMRLPIMKNGELNGILIYTEVGMPSGAIIRRNATTFLNNDIILALKPTMRVNKGDSVRLQLSYTCGAKPSSASLEASILD